MIMLKNILVKKGKRVLLDLPELRLPSGQVTVILGPNGAGKSTLLKVLSGGIKPDQGDVFLFGLKLSEWTSRKLAQSRAMLSQNYSLPFPMPVRDLVAMGRFPHDRSASEEHMVTAMMNELDLNAFSERNVQTLSGGEQQRAHMARVLLQLKDDDDRPKLLLLDEPISSLDIVHQKTILKLARDCAVKGYTVVIVLHDINLAIHYADQFLILKKGRLASQTKDLCPQVLSDVFETPMHFLEDSVESKRYFFASHAR